jgi:hypothetical protein
MAWLTGKPGTGAGSARARRRRPGRHRYDWLDCVFVNIPSPWKDPARVRRVIIEAGHLIPGYYPTRLATASASPTTRPRRSNSAAAASTTRKNAPVEQFETGNGATKTFATARPDASTTGAAARKGRPSGRLRRPGRWRTPDRRKWTTSSKAGGRSRLDRDDQIHRRARQRRRSSFCYFTRRNTPTRSRSTPARSSSRAVRGRNIRILIDGKRDRRRPDAELEATVEGEVERELGNEEIVGRVVNGTDCNGTFTIRAKDKATPSST